MNYEKKTIRLFKLVELWLFLIDLDVEYQNRQKVAQNSPNELKKEE